MDMDILFPLVNTFYAESTWKWGDPGQPGITNSVFYLAMHVVHCTLEKMFEIFLEISDDLILDKETFKALQMRAEAL